MILRAIKIRLYPNKTQEQTLNKVLGCYRFVYNQMLALKQEAYNRDKSNLGLCELSKFFHRTLLKDEQYAWLKEQNTKVMKQAIRQMLSAYDGFFKLGKGFPKFKSKHDNNSALFPCEAISKSNAFETKHISLTKSLKNIRLNERQFRSLINESVKLVLNELLDSDYILDDDKTDELLGMFADDERDEEEYYKDLTAGEYNPINDEYDDEPNAWLYR